MYGCPADCKLKHKLPILCAKKSAVYQYLTYSRVCHHFQAEWGSSAPLGPLDLSVSIEFSASKLIVIAMLDAGIDVQLEEGEVRRDLADLS